MSLVGNAHLVAGDADTILVVLAFLKKQEMETAGNPDLSIKLCVQFGIDEARELRARAHSRAIGSGPRVFIVCAAKMTAEAQNALLKTLEEPPAGALFFFIVPNPHTLLPTLRSRAQILSLDGARREGVVDAKAFIAATPKGRLDMLAPLLRKDENDERDISAIFSFLSALERAGGAALGKRGAEAIYRAKRYLNDKGALVKPLLESVALLVPRMRS